MAGKEKGESSVKTVILFLLHIEIFRQVEKIENEEVDHTSSFCREILC
jgi:hypothetical protein